MKKILALFVACAFTFAIVLSGCETKRESQTQPRPPGGSTPTPKMDKKEQEKNKGVSKKDDDKKDGDKKDDDKKDGDKKDDDKKDGDKKGDDQDKG